MSSKDPFSTTGPYLSIYLSIYLSLLSRSISDHHLRCGGWLNLEFSKREKHGVAILWKKSMSHLVSPSPDGGNRIQGFQVAGPLDDVETDSSTTSLHAMQGGKRKHRGL